MILVGSATCGKSAGALEIVDTFKKEINDQQLDAEVIEVGCIGLCYLEPIVTIIKPNMPAIFYGQVTKKIAKNLVTEYLKGNNPMTEYALGTVGEKKVEGIPLHYLKYL